MKIITLIAILPLFLSLTAANAGSAENSVHGKYKTLLLKLHCPQDEKQYGRFSDSGFYKAGSHCGQDTPAGYWVYAAPYWFIWQEQAKQSEEQKIEMAKAGGKYSGLLLKFSAPEDEKQYGEFQEYGFYEATTYKNRSIPKGYWVYLAPDWYVWAKKDLSAAGFMTTEKKVKLKEQTLLLSFEHQKTNATWAKDSLEQLAEGIAAIEQYTGIPYPGANPYRIEERENFSLLGQADRNAFLIASPPKGSLWTMLHEAVHIWNVGTRPLWISEGLANFISALVIEKLKFKFKSDETYQIFIDGWMNDRKKGKDSPLYEGGKDLYNNLHMGKAMHFWKLLHRSFGDRVVIDFFRAGLELKTVSNKDALKILKKYDPDPAKLLSGWVTSGQYYLTEKK